MVVDEKLDMSQQCVLAAQEATRTLGCTNSSVGGRGFSPSALPYETPPGACAQLLGSLQRKDMDVLEQVQSTATIIKGLKHLNYN